MAMRPYTGLLRRFTPRNDKSGYRPFLTKPTDYSTHYSYSKSS